MPAPMQHIERGALLRSIAATTVISALGIVWGLGSGSQMILLDGVYAVIGIAVSWLLLRASALAAQGPSHHYPYGREAVTPLVIGVQGFVLLATLMYAAIGSVRSILDGGSVVAAGWAIAYGVIATVASLGFWAWLRRVADGSELLTAEATAWRVATLRGIGMIAGFSIIWLVAGSAWDAAAPYVDPVMVLATCLLFLSAPIRMVRTTIVELLERAPAADIRRPVSDAIAEVRGAYDLDPPEVRMTKVGSKLYVEVEGVVGPGVTVAHEHQVREAIRRRLDELPFDVWLNVELRPRPADEPPPPLASAPPPDAP